MYYSHPCITRTEYFLNSFEIKKKEMFYVKHEEFICALFTKLPDTKCQISLGELKMAELGRFRVETDRIYDNAN